MRPLLFVLTLAAGAALALVPTTDAQQPNSLNMEVDKDKIDFFINKQLVTSYHTKSSWPRPFFYPLKTIDGIETTRAWPVGKALAGEKTDHVHHRSAWFTYGDIIPEGMALKTKLKGIEGVDFWSEAKGHGKIVCTGVVESKSFPNQPKITVVTKNEWRTTEGDKVLDETRKITVVNFGKAYLIVLDIDLHASVFPLTFGDTKEGAMAIRTHPESTVQGGKGKMENAEGKINEKPIWGFKSAWCDYSGPVNGTVVGVAVMDDPKNPYPACWHARDYGLMAANPFGRDKSSKFPGVKGNNERVRLALGEHLHLRYGLLVHNGDAPMAQVADYFQRFVKLRD